MAFAEFISCFFCLNFSSRQAFHISFLQLFQVGDESVTLPYWLSNASALLCLLQRNLRSNGFFNASSQRSPRASGLTARVVHVSNTMRNAFFQVFWFSWPKFMFYSSFV